MSTVTTPLASRRVADEETTDGDTTWYPPDRSTRPVGCWSDVLDSETSVTSSQPAFMPFTPSCEDESLSSPAAEFVRDRRHLARVRLVERLDLGHQLRERRIGGVQLLELIFVDVELRRRRAVGHAARDVARAAAHFAQH